MTYQAPLAGTRVLEVGTGFALAYCGKLFADFGAEVVKAEPPGGDPLRRAPPLLGGESALFAWLTTNRRSITAGDLAPWLAGADVLLDGRAPGARTPIAGEDDPGLIRCDLSWFGETGPYAGYAGTDAVARALAGVFFCTGPVEGPPQVLDGFPGETLAGLAAGIATLSALLSRAEGGRRLEANVLETNLAVSEYYVTQALLTPGLVRRQGRDRFFPTWPMGVYPCAEGTFLGVTVVTPAQWRGFCDMLGLPALGADPDLVVGPNRIARLAEIEAAFAPRLLTRRADSWHAECLERRLPCVAVPDMATLLRTEQHRGRGAFAPVTMGASSFEAPVLPHRLPRTPPAPGGAAPRLGADDGSAPPPPRARPQRRATTPQLDGVTILDLSMGWAGPLCTRLLGDLGATILKVEAIQYPDWWRGLDPRPAFFAEKQYETNTRYNALNRNKTGITLDLTQAEGAALLKRLVAQCDAVVENYAREVLPKLGLDYAALSAARPDLVMVSMPAFGAEGPWRDARAYGSTLEHASGLPSVAGEDGTPPVTSHLAYGDPVGGTNAAVALLLALLHRQRSGEGQHVDLAQVECIMQFTAPWLISQAAIGHGLGGAPLPRLGNRHPLHVPQGCFPCAGEDRWILVSVTDDAAWRGACGVLGRPELAGLDAAARRERQAELEALIAGWTRGRDADAAMAALQAAGVAAGVCRNPIHLMEDAQLVARQVFQPIERRFVGRHLQLSAPFREAGAGPLPVRRPAPTLGEDNAAVLGGRLGLTGAELAVLAQAAVIGTEAVPIAGRKSRASTG